jgi:hypothetical protein
VLLTAVKEAITVHRLLLLIAVKEAITGVVVVDDCSQRTGQGHG